MATPELLTEEDFETLCETRRIVPGLLKDQLRRVLVLGEDPQEVVAGWAFAEDARQLRGSLNPQRRDRREYWQVILDVRDRVDVPAVTADELAEHCRREAGQ